VGHDDASTVYVTAKRKAALGVGLPCEIVTLDTPDEDEAVARVAALGEMPDVTAMIVQLPLPAGWDVQQVLDAIPPAKDADGLTTAQKALQAAGDPAAIWPATPLGVMRLLDFYGIDVTGKRAVVIGQSDLVGKPLAALLKTAGAEVVTFGKSEPDPMNKARAADILCVATGAVHLITPEWVKPGAVVVDVGITRRARADGTTEIVGDVRPDVAAIAGGLTPVPGGVGPTTVGCLLANAVGI